MRRSNTRRPCLASCARPSCSPKSITSCTCWPSTSWRTWRCDGTARLGGVGVVDCAAGVVVQVAAGAVGARQEAPTHAPTRSPRALARAWVGAELLSTVLPCSQHIGLVGHAAAAMPASPAVLLRGRARQGPLLRRAVRAGAARGQRAAAPVSAPWCLSLCGVCKVPTRQT